MEKARDWFGRPMRAVNTVVWLCWVSILVSVLVNLLFFAVLGVRALVT